MYIVTRTFRDANGVFGVGSVVDPTSVKTFRSRLQQRHIVNVDERNLDEWVKYFKNRHGIDLSNVLAEYLDTQPEVEEPVITESSSSNDQISPTIESDEPELAQPEVEEPVITESSSSNDQISPTIESDEPEPAPSEEDESW